MDCEKFTKTADGLFQDQGTHYKIYIGDDFKAKILKIQ
jgi:hypothetical protein